MFGIIADAEFESQLIELTGENNKPKPRATVVSIDRGRGLNNKEVPIEIKKIIAGEAIAGTPARELSELFDVSESSISAYKNGATSTSTYNEPNKELKNSNDKVREGIVTSARSKLLSALENITNEKLENARVRDVAGIAKDMSAIIKNMEPTQDSGNKLNQQFIFYAPHTKKESDFETIEVGD